MGGLSALEDPRPFVNDKQFECAAIRTCRLERHGSPDHAAEKTGRMRRLSGDEFRTAKGGFSLLLRNDADSELRWSLVASGGRSSASERISQADPVRDARSDEVLRQPDREVVDSGNTASRNHQVVPEHNPVPDEPQEGIKDR